MENTAVEWLEEQLDILLELYPSQWEEVNKSIEQAKEMENEQKHQSIDNQVDILKVTLEEMMTGFDSEEDRIDFILDICNGYKKKINI